MTKKNWQLKIFRLPKRVLLIGLLFLCATYGFWQLTSQKAPPPPPQKYVEVEPVQKVSLRQVKELLGTIKSAHQTSITAKGKGRFDCRVEPGSIIKKDQLIGRIDNPSLAKTYELLKMAESLAEKQFLRAETLLSQGFASKRMVEEKKKELLEAQNKTMQTKIALEELQVKAPFDGVVGVFKARDGSQVAPGDVLVHFYDPKSRIVEFEVPLSIGAAISDGTPVLVHGVSYPLTHIQKMLDKETHMCPAFVELPDLEGIIGSTVPIELVTQDLPSVIAIPYEALFLKDKKPHVYVVKEDKVVLTPVEIGVRQKDLVEITKGLSVGDQLVVLGHTRLTPEEPVTISSAKDLPSISSLAP